MGDESKNFQKSYFDVLGLCCSSEIPLIEKILKPLDGIQKVSVIVPSKTVIVLHDTQIISQLQIVKALNQARLEASIRSYGTDKMINKWPSPYILACGILLLISLFQRFYQPLKWIAIAAVLIALPQIILRSFAAIRRYTLDINILMLIAVGGAVALGDYSEAGFIVFLFTIAEWLESMASHKATTGMSLLMNLAPQKAILAETGQIVDANDVKVGTILAIKAGEVIPIDGVVVEGRSEVDEKSLTGESFPVAKQLQSLVWAGTLNIDGYISVKTTALAEHSAVAKMARLVEEAQNNKSKTQRMIDCCAKYYTPAVVVIAAVVALLPIILSLHDQRHWFKLALVLLVSACPCALVLSTPVATFCALLKAARIGLLVKGGDVLEELAKSKVVAFDKTGTITRGEFSLIELRQLSSEVTMDTLLSWILSLESKSNHPMASALVDYARFNTIEPKAENVNEFQIYPGEGVSGEINGKKIYIGNKRIAMRAGCTRVPDVEDMKEAVTLGYVLLDAMPIGIFALSDTCRTGAKEGIKELKSLGIKTAMLTGDSTTAAMQAQKQLGHIIEEIHAELLPEDKVRIISDLKTKKGSTTMVGDGMNDAPALAMANVGISMGVSGSAVAMETSHITLMSNDIQKIPKAIRLARRTQHKIITNIVFSIITKVAILGLAIGGHPLLWAAVLADVGTCLIVILNSMTLLPTNKKKVKKCCQRSNHQRPTCRDKCSKGPCGSNSANCHSNHGFHKTAEDKKPCCESPSESKECQAESPSPCCQGKVTCKAKTGSEHSIYVNCEKDSHRDDESCLNHSVRQIKHLHKSKANHEHLISPISHEEHNEHSPCEQHLSKQFDHGSHSHHESGKHEAESRNGHSDHDITCNLKTNATKNCCNAFVDQTVGAGANLTASTICNGSETKTSDSCCESERKDCHEKHQCSNLLASKFKENGGCCRSYRKECSRRETCCGNGMMQVPEIVIE
ncbi:hypothetical protein M5K25_006139 [Dendrobium thyrsiflorum]|uniref:HMA domain-containing protein n=1 Tax=Dendrobium thyrsiflorum TaxID=117978 RepID=A0ABD0VAM2_DENTH